MQMASLHFCYLWAAVERPQGLTVPRFRAPWQTKRVIFHLFTQKLISVQMTIFNQ